LLLIITKIMDFGIVRFFETSIGSGWTRTGRGWVANVRETGIADLFHCHGKIGVYMGV
jgi:hypothetical protein